MRGGLYAKLRTLAIDDGEKNKARSMAGLEVCGAGERSRTLDLRITNALLYQLSYTGR